MGHKLDEWTAKVASLVRDATGRDVDATTIEDVGLRPAFARFSKDQPLDLVKESAGTGSPYLTTPTGWVTGFSNVVDVEFPARQNPPNMLDDQNWRVVRSATDVAVTQILLNQTPAASQYVRITFTAPWPFPTATAADDLVDDVAYEAVASLAVSHCLRHLAAEAARNHSGRLGTDFTEGGSMAQALRDAAADWEQAYKDLLGIGTEAGNDAAPASGRLDFDPSYFSLFHGGRV